MSEFQVGDKVRRTATSSYNFTLDREYTVAVVLSDGFLRIAGDRGSVVRTHRSNYAPITKGNAVNDKINAYPTPYAAAPTGVMPTAAELRKRADAVEKAEQEAAAHVAEAQAREAEMQALAQRLSDDKSLALATSHFLNCAASLLQKGELVSPSEVLAKHRKALQPLAESYGLRIVLVGNKTTASLVLA